MFHLDLVDSRQVVLDWIFGRNDLPVGPVEAVECGIEGRRLAGSGWAGHEDDSVGPSSQVHEGLVGLLRKA